MPNCNMDTAELKHRLLENKSSNHGYWKGRAIQAGERNSRWGLPHWLQQNAKIYPIREMKEEEFEAKTQEQGDRLWLDPLTMFWLLFWDITRLQRHDKLWHTFKRIHSVTVMTKPGKGKDGNKEPSIRLSQYTTGDSVETGDSRNCVSNQKRWDTKYTWTGVQRVTSHWKKDSWEQGFQNICSEVVRKCNQIMSKSAMQFPEQLSPNSKQEQIKVTVGLSSQSSKF